LKVLESIAGLAAIPGPLCVAIGVFDGVHLGHQELIGRTMHEADRLGATAAALTFHPHPARVLRPESAPHLLTSAMHKQRLLKALGCPVLACQAFDREFAAQPPEVFIEALVQAARPLKMICVGHNWAFGKNRSGNAALLNELGRRLDFQTLEIEPVTVDGELVSSTRIRRAVQEGDFATARTLLGRDYTILGTVRRGQQLGGRIGFPTANLAAHNEQFPPDGVYAVRAMLEGKSLGGVANIGTRPTVNDSPERLLEVHLFDFSADCYGKDLEVSFAGFLRPEKKFASVEELKAQIARDAASASEMLRGGRVL
jgi:riboflavin kinase/FMN adenylyltransferase